MKNDASQITLKDIAGVLGVSPATVSLAMRNHPKIPEEHRILIQNTAQRMGYRPDPMATALVHRRWHTTAHPISAEVAWLNHWQEPRKLRGYKEFDLYWQGAQQAANKLGFRLEEFVVGGDLSFRWLEKILQSRNIQGILVPPHGNRAVTSLDERSLNWNQYSVVKFGYSIPSLPANVVGSNQTQGTMLAFSEIRKRGYQRIGYVCHLCPSTRSKAGFLMSQTDLPSEQRLPLLELNADAKDCNETFQGWLEMNQPDAILTEMAEVRSLLEQLGFQVPRDIALASTSVLDGNADAGIYQNSEDIGRIAAETLVGLIYNHQAGFPARHCETLVDAAWQDGATLPDRRRLSD